MNRSFFTTFFGFIIATLSYIQTFNVDFEYTVVKSGPKDSLFGFSVTEHHDGKAPWMLVGAPRGMNAELKKFNVNSSGTVFRCKATDPNTACDGEVNFDDELNSNYESKKDQWFGVSLKSGGLGQNIISCAHRYEYYGKSRSFRLLEGKCWRVDGEFFQLSELQACRYINNGGNVPTHDSYGQCESGVAVDILPEVNDETSYLIGAVGSLGFTGRVFDISTDDANKQYENPRIDDSYFGYAVTYGKFLNKDKFTIATGGPRYNSFGKVLLFTDKTFKSVVQSIPVEDSEIQIASGFGIALCSIDANGDGFSELIVGAPFHSNADNQRPNQGLVYVYSKKDGEDKMSLLRTLQGFTSKGGMKAYSSFGYAVANAGDLNLDGYEDIVIGAPHQDGGAVYIYQGSDAGLTNEPSQYIPASTVFTGLNGDVLSLSGFGKSFGTGMDLDQNGYKDILVGAYLSDQAVLLRSRPVITPHISLSFQPKQLKTGKNCIAKIGNTTCFDMIFCVNFTESSGKLYNKSDDEIKIQYTFTADVKAKKSRVRFSSGKTMHTVIKATKKKSECVTMKGMYLVYNEEDNTIPIYPDITFEVAYDLPYNDGLVKPGKSTSQVVNLDAYPSLTESYKGGEKIKYTHALNYELTFQRECEKCIPDLSIIADKNYSVGFGRKTFKFNMTIKNSGRDPAYSVGFKFDFKKDLQVESVTDETNKAEACPNSVCEGIFNQISQGKELTVEVVLNTEKFQATSPNTFSVTVTSANNDLNDTLSDNTATISLELKVDADIQLLPGTFTQQVLYTGIIKGESAMKKLPDVGKTVDHKFLVLNNGPDVLPSAQLRIRWPYETLSEKHLLYIVKVVKTSRATSCVTPQQNFLKIPGVVNDPVASKFTATVDGDMESKFSQKRTRRDAGTNATDAPSTNAPVTEASGEATTAVPGSGVGDTRKKDGRVLDCKTAKCVDIVCTFEDVQVGKTEFITIKSRLWQSSVLIDYYGEVLTIVSEGRVDIGTNASYIFDPDMSNNALELFTIVNPDFAPKEKERKLWVYVIAALAGVVLLALLICGLWKLGFFKRKRVDSSKYGVKSGKGDKSLLAK